MLAISTEAVMEEHPLELLFACHEKVRRFTDVTGRMVEHVRTYGADASAREAAGNVLRYFDIALPKHHADEEEDVFPALRDLQDATLNAAMDALRVEHQVLDAAWQEIRVWLTLIAAGETPACVPAELPAFIAGNPAHAEREEREVFAALGRLAPQTLDAVAARMRQRRGAK